ncbi:hypothetical protein [Thermoleptolyngbya sp. C42_A2020_037]|uniref:hypothetical protein n=1 Tax=Thermoleptolyngbya sp. C42_A2020_037 TaxID=2747799 RepID=UPI0019E614E2|nr:hypothetical protein [Thermoleptolyngbya sp. C42_A2020_037]MBF2083026.1 hypothetical protein [Thermoleptolyngbya sp. C42_A2020_037]
MMARLAIALPSSPNLSSFWVQTMRTRSPQRETHLPHRESGIAAPAEESLE